MSRSYNKTPILGNACYVSNKPWKRLYNRQYRHNEKIKLNNCAIDEYTPSHYHDTKYGNICSSCSDGFHYFNVYDNRRLSHLTVEMKKESLKKWLRKINPMDINVEIFNITNSL